MKTMTWMMTMALATALGCGSPVGKDNNVNPDPDPDPDTHDYQDVTFTVTNQGLSSVFVDQTRQVLTIYHGNDAYTPGGICQAAETGDTGDGGFSGAPQPNPDGNSLDAAPIEPSLELRPGGQWTRGWNGMVLGEGNCPNLTHLFGEELIVEFCYGTNIEGADEWSSFPTNLECARQAFVFSDDPTTVDIDLDSEVVTGDTLPIIVENTLEAPIFVQLSDNCGGSTFYSVTHGDQEINTRDLCGPCDCSEGADCSLGCDAACEAPMVAVVEPGSTVEREFSLTYLRLYDEGTHQCTQVQHVPVGPLTATICYGRDAELTDGEMGNITAEVCETLQFTTTDEEVRLVVQ